MMRDVLYGLLTYVLSIAALLGAMSICFSLLAPPVADRARSFAFTAGGGAAFFVLLIALVACAVLYSIFSKPV